MSSVEACLNTLNAALCSESMLRPLPMGRSLSGWRTPVAAPIDYSARLRAYSESIAGQRKELNDLKELFQREKAEIRASPPVPPYAVRKAFHNKEETERKLALEKEEKEKKIQFQRAKAEADAAAAEKRRSASCSAFYLISHD